MKIYLVIDKYQNIEPMSWSEKKSAELHAEFKNDTDIINAPFLVKTLKLYYHAKEEKRNNAKSTRSNQSTMFNSNNMPYRNELQFNVHSNS